MLYENHAEPLRQLPAIEVGSASELRRRRAADSEVRMLARLLLVTGICLLTMTLAKIAFA